MRINKEIIGLSLREVPGERKLASNGIDYYNSHARVLNGDVNGAAFMVHAGVYSDRWIRARVTSRVPD